MEDNGLSAENYAEWAKLTKAGEITQSYKDWLASD